MPTSQFTIYTSSDLYGPGPLNGITGSLLTVLDACLVNGYGTGSSYKRSVGWTKPIPNSASCGCYKQISGSQYTLFINDAGPNAFGGREAQATGWITMSNVVAAGSASNVGAGWGQFPTPSQSLSIGTVVWKKSNTQDAVPRSWIIAADPSTMYIWMAEGSLAGYYTNCGFGDFYSLTTETDFGKCLIYGKNLQASATTTGVECGDSISQGSWVAATGRSLIFSPLPGHYMASSPKKILSSYPLTKKGDVGASSTGTATICTMDGTFATPNPYDNSLYITPIWTVDTSSAMIRGRYRGYYQLCHPITNFNDGQIIQGSGDYSNKTFMVIKRGYAGGMWCIEISPTIETN